MDTNGNGASDREEFYVYDGDDVALDFVDANGATGGLNPVLTTRYLHGPSVDQILAQEDTATTDVLWMLTDQLGSVRDIVNQKGEAVSHITYDAFGNVIGGTGVLLTRYLWTGRELDPLTGLQYNRNRWYDPALGRWVSEDPIGFWGGAANLYSYVANRPLSYIDPNGLKYWDIGGSIGLPFIGPVAGVFIAENGAIYPNAGGGLMTPGPSGSVLMGLMGQPAPGWAAQGAVACMPVAAAAGVDTSGNKFVEAGVGFGYGPSLTGYYTFPSLGELWNQNWVWPSDKRAKWW